MTTIRVEQSLRDHINEIAADRGTTAGSVIEALLEEHLERALMAEVKRKMNSMTPAERADYEAEIAVWDSVVADGLEEYEGEYVQEWQALLAREAREGQETDTK